MLRQQTASITHLIQIFCLKWMSVYLFDVY